MQVKKYCKDLHGYMADKSNFVGVKYGVDVFAIYTKRIAEMVE